MKLRPVVASVLLLGISGVAFADTTSATTTNSNVQTQLNAMQAQINQMQQIINQNGGGTQSGGGTSLQTTLGTSPAWYNAISVSGLLNVDGIASTRSPAGGSFAAQPPATVFGNGSSSDLSLSNADLFVDAQINDWTKAHVGLNYQSNYLASPEDFDTSDATPVIQNVSGSFLDEAYVTIGNFTESPFYFRAGKQYLNFGNYDRYAAVPTFTQLLTETNATAATVGFVEDMFYGSAYAFRGSDDDNGATNINNFGANIGIANQNQNLGYNVSAGYLNNMADVNYVASTNQALNNTQTYNPLSNTGYTDKVGGLSLDGSMNIGIFDMDAHWVTALNPFSSNDIVNTTNGYYTTSGARPQALTVGGGVTFDVIGHSSRLGVDYQHSWQAENIGLYGLPQERYEGTYTIDVSKNVNVGLDVYHDLDYSIGDGASDRSATTGLIRLGVMFA